MLAATLAGCSLAVFGLADRVDRLPVAPDSAAIVASMGAEDELHPDVGRRYGIPFQVVSRRTPRRRVRFDYAGESDRVRYPIPARVRIEDGGDRHALLLDRDSCRLHELYALRREGGRWAAGSGAVWSLRRPRLRPAGWTSADAAGLPILPLLVRYDEVRRGSVDHAIRVTARVTRRSYVFPARHQAGSTDAPSAPRMGERLRLRASVDVSSLPPQARVIAVAMQRYGLVVADNGSDWFFQGAPDRRWDDEQLNALKDLKGSDFEVVRVG